MFRLRSLAALLSLGPVWVLPGLARAATFDVCAYVDIDTTDSGFVVNGTSEDIWPTANNGISLPVDDWRIRVSRGLLVIADDPAASNGCITFSDTQATGFTVRVYGDATDSSGNRIRIHDAETDTSSETPGNTLFEEWTNQTLSTTNYNIYYVDGAADDRYTTMAAAYKGLTRYGTGIVSNKTISFGFDEGDCQDSGSTHGNAENYIESDDAHLVRIGRCGSTASDAREKMIVTHELGHVVARLHYGYDGDDAPRNQTYDYGSSLPSGCQDPGGGDPWDSYGMRTVEFDSQAFKEGFADFYSTRVWNDRASNATYVYRGVGYDAERWDHTGGSNTSGGVIMNHCGVDEYSITTKGDWLRFFWDWHSYTCSSDYPTTTDLLNLYRWVRENDRTNEYNLVGGAQDPLVLSNYAAAMKYAAQNSLSGLASCLTTDYRIDYYSEWNEIDGKLVP